MIINDRLSVDSLYTLSTTLVWCSKGELSEVLTSAELALFSDTGLEKSPSEKELDQLVPGYEERILSAVLERIKADPEDTAGAASSVQTD